MDSNNILNKVKELVRKGNVSKIVVRRNGEVLVSIPVNVGVVGAVIGLTAAKWAVLAAVLATVGFGCSVEILKDDGEVVNVVSEEDTVKAKDTGETAEETSKTYKVVGIGKAAFNNQKKLTEVVIPKTIQYIEKQAFGFTGLTNVIISADNVVVKKWAFFSCDNLKVVTLNGKKPRCSTAAFELCWNMEELRIRGISERNNGKKLKSTNAVIKVIK